MALILLGLYLLIQSSLASVDTHSKICGLDRVGYLKSSDGYYLFVNGKRVESHNLICEALGLYLEKGCQFEDGDWEWISRRYCDREFISRTTAISGRKLLTNPSANTSVPDQLSRKDQREEKISAPVLAVAIPGMFLLCCALMCPCFQAKKKEPAEQNIMSTELNLMDSVSTLVTSSALEKIPPGSPLRVPGSPLRVPGSPQRVPPSPSRFMTSQQVNRIGSMHLSINQIIKATQNFSLTSKMGEGGLGTVYKAVLPDGQIVAVKRAKKEHFSSALDEFSNEVELLSKIEHRNLVRLLGYTDNGNERIIITEYVANGTLREHLDGQHGKILDFNQRLEISIDVASALTYLHLYAEKPIIHRDVKSSNILLTESFRAKVSDFGFAKIGPTEAEQTHILTKVRGTAGYLDPEYLKTYKLTPKSDVFSFGILLIEILSARRPVELRRSMDERITVRWAFKNYNEGNVMAILDPQLNEPVDGEVVMKMLSLAFQCAAPTRADRPVMKEVGEQLWEIRKDFARTRRA